VTSSSERTPRLPPRWFIRLAWKAHRGLYRVTGGRRGLWPEREGKWGTMRVTTVGRRTGEPRSVILAYLEDGPDLVTLAMNGWGEGDPAWWLNLRAEPRATVRLPDGERDVVAHAATGAERERLWERYRAVDRDLDAYAARRSTETPVVVLSPARSASSNGTRTSAT
jgi:deazaflavin-dependent oxidoreductase (nitroreductase family)